MITLNTQQHLKEDLLILSRCFTFFLSHRFLFCISFHTSSKIFHPQIFFQLKYITLYIKKHHVYNPYRISYTFSYVMCYIVSEMWIGGRSLQDCFYCYFQQIISAEANEFLILCNIIKRAPEKQNL